MQNSPLNNINDNDDNNEKKLKTPSGKMGVNIPGGNFLGGDFPGGGNSPGASLIGGNSLDANFLGRSFPDTAKFHHNTVSD